MVLLRFECLAFFFLAFLGGDCFFLLGYWEVELSISPRLGFFSFCAAGYRDVVRRGERFLKFALVDIGSTVGVGFTGQKELTLLFAWFALS